jgi:hypothetical protein
VLDPIIAGSGWLSWRYFNRISQQHYRGGELCWTALKKDWMTEICNTKMQK